MRKKLIWSMIALMCPVLTAAAGPREARPALHAKPQLLAAKFDTSHSYDVRHYRLRLRPVMTKDSLYGQQTVTAVSLTAGLDTVMLNSVRLTVDSVKLDGNPAGFRQPADSLLVGVGGLSWGRQFTLDIYYRGGNFSANGTYSRGYYWYPKSAQTLKTTGYTCSAPQDARKWMPCFDEPWDKADSGCAFEISVPDSFCTAANGVLEDTVRNGDMLTWRWNEAGSISTYLMAFHVSQYSFWTDTARTAAGDTVPLLYFVWSSDSVQSRTAFANVPAMMECYTSRFGRYPFGKYAMAAVYPFVFGGMENQDMTTIIRNWIGTNDQYGIAHELSHMWWGDLVTCGTWADIWLNEGFGSYCEAIYDEYRTGSCPGVYMAQNFYAATSGNAMNYPIYNPPMELIYDYSMEYAKGAWVLHMLRGVMGDPAFFPMMRAYGDSFAYGSAVTADFQRLAERFHGSNLQWFFDQWVYQRAGYPTYDAVIYQRTHPDSNSAVMKIIHGSTSGDTYVMPLALSCSTAAGRRDTVVWIDSSFAGPFRFDEGSTINSLKVDPDEWVLKTLNYAAPFLNTVTPGPGQLTLRWKRFTLDPVPPAGYNIYRSSSAAGAYTRINEPICTDTFYTDTGLAAGTAYFYKVTAVCGEDTCFETRLSSYRGGIPTGVSGNPAETELAVDYRLLQNNPNPFDRSTVIGYQLAAGGETSLKVYNMAGQLVRTLVQGVKEAGRHSVKWDGRDGQGKPAHSGRYLVLLESGNIRQTKVVTLIK